MKPVSRGPAAVFDWIWRHVEVLEWHALEQGSAALLEAVERLQSTLGWLEAAFCERRRPERRGPLLAQALYQAAHLDRVLQAEAGDHPQLLEALGRLRASFGALEDLLEIETMPPPRPPGSEGGA